MALTRIQYMGPDSTAPLIPGVPSGVKTGPNVTVRSDGSMVLTPTGVAAGSYFDVDITVGSDGRIIRCNDGSPQINPLTDFEPGTIMIFGNSFAPPGWTQKTDSIYNNTAIRLVKTAGGGSGGETSFTAMAAPFRPAGTNTQSLSISKLNVGAQIGGVFVSTQQLGAHTHQFGFTKVNQYVGPGGAGALNTVSQPWDFASLTATTTNSKSNHYHTFTGSTTGATFSGTVTFTGTLSTQFEVEYFDMIVAQSA